MHAELMDFNVLLQQSLCQKDALIDRLKKELEELRGPMPTDDVQTSENTGRVNVWIPSAFLTGVQVDHIVICCCYFIFSAWMWCVTSDHVNV